MKELRGTDMLTATGAYFDLLNPTPEAIDISHIATALGNLCRFGGACQRFYSVAEHSCQASFLVPRRFKLEALLHDAAEAYVQDLINPVKTILPSYKALEKRIDKVIRLKFKLPPEMSPEVREADQRMLGLEQREVMHNSDAWRGTLLPPPGTTIWFWSPEFSGVEFMTYFTHLMNDPLEAPAAL